ncbi:MAG TPA: VIT domain-containing protein [Candidatus Polarisedimenticolia bacterium]|jgi:Ca-activated chloride channel family protein|nr:VIT domain-containing protein [Candidatus Polarisedimenticolia bacterium]
MTASGTRNLLRIVLLCLLALPPGGGALASEPRGPRLAGASENQDPFLLKSTDVKVVITGPVAHAVVTQSWENPNPYPVDGLYIFPLPAGAAVTDMSLRIGDRLIQGDMKRRAEARAIYEQARAGGRVAGLLDQERPNVFAQQVANIIPGARVQVILSFDHEIRCEDGACEYVFPTVVGPRFIPCRQTDPGKIDPPVVVPDQVTGQRLTMRVALDEGIEIRDLRSPSHRVGITQEDEKAAQVRLSDEDGRGAALNRDFRLLWRLGGEATEMGILAWRNASEESGPGVFTLVLQPPAEPGDEEAAPRELIFVLDCSGSMMGVPIEAAKNVVRKALVALRPGDTFQIVRFSDRASGLGPAPLAATPENLRRARIFLDSLRGEGGTEMISGIRAALARPADPERLRIVAFLTDGYIGNESEILGEVRRLLGGARLFSFGIGSSVNRYLLEGLAEEGRGEAAFLAPRETPDQMVERFVERIETPVLTDIRMTWKDLEVEDQEPRNIPDLFAGSPLVVHGRYLRPGTGLLRLEGTSHGLRRVLRRVVTLPAEAADHEALGRLWARARIHRLERELHDGAQPEVVEAITRLGLRHRLMTAYTSLVAVDSEVSNYSGSSTEINVPVEMPQDVSYEGNFGVAGNMTGFVARQSLMVQGYGDAKAQAPPASTGAGVPSSSPRETAKAEPYLDKLGRKRKDGSGRENAGGAANDSVDREEGDSSRSFESITVVLPGGTELSVESDGELWRTQGKSRTLVASLAAREMAELRTLLAAARPETWTGGGSGGRIVFAGAGMARAASLPSANPAIQALSDWVKQHAK